MRAAVSWWKVYFLLPNRDDHPLALRRVKATTKGQARNEVRRMFPGYIVAFLAEEYDGYAGSIEVEVKKK